MSLWLISASVERFSVSRMLDKKINPFEIYIWFCMCAFLGIYLPRPWKQLHKLVVKNVGDFFLVLVLPVCMILAYFVIMSLALAFAFPLFTFPFFLLLYVSQSTHFTGVQNYVLTSQLNITCGLLKKAKQKMCNPLGKHVILNTYMEDYSWDKLNALIQQRP